MPARVGSQTSPEWEREKAWNHGPAVTRDVAPDQYMRETPRTLQPALSHPEPSAIRLGAFVMLT